MAEEQGGQGRERTTEEHYGLPPVLTVDEVAAFMRINRKTVYAAIKAGDIPGRKVGNRVVVLRDALLRSLDWPEVRVLPVPTRSGRPRRRS